MLSDASNADVHAGQKKRRKGLSLNQLRRMSDKSVCAKKSGRQLLGAYIVIFDRQSLRRRVGRYAALLQ